MRGLSPRNVQGQRNPTTRRVSIVHGTPRDRRIRQRALRHLHRLDGCGGDSKGTCETCPSGHFFDACDNSCTPMPDRHRRVEVACDVSASHPRCTACGLQGRPVKTQVTVECGPRSLPWSADIPEEGMQLRKRVYVSAAHDDLAHRDFALDGLVRGVQRKTSTTMPVRRALQTSASRCRRARGGSRWIARRKRSTPAAHAGVTCRRRRM